MKIIEAINIVDARKPNVVSEPEKVRPLALLDGHIKLEIIDTHEGGGVYFVPYGDDTPRDTELLVGPPWDDLYIKYLECEIDSYTGDQDRYNNSAAAFNEAYEAFAAWYNRTHMPKPVRPRYF